ncbi:MAG TPA: TerC family protein [bacterium]|nr:TerC family protein [bacterium]
MLHDFVVVLTLILMEGLLSADNALVLAILVRHLPGNQRKKALKYGIIGAFVFRLIAILIATHLIRFWYFQLAGGVYLVYICIAHFIRHSSTEQTTKTGFGRGFWGTVVVVELTDIAFSVDSILAAVGLSNKLWVIYTGGVLGIIAMRFVAGGFLRLLDLYPGLVAAAYCLVGWIGLKLCLEAIHQPLPQWHPMPHWLFWSVMVILFVQGFFHGKVEEGKSKEEVFAEITKEENNGARGE